VAWPVFRGFGYLLGGCCGERTAFLCEGRQLFRHTSAAASLNSQRSYYYSYYLRLQFLVTKAN